MQKMYVNEEDNKLSALLNLSKLALGRDYEFELNKEQDWIRELLLELNENVNLLPPEMYLRHTHLNIHLKITKKFKDTYKEYLLVEGHVDSQYRTQCVKTLKDMTETLNFDFLACFIDKHFNQEEEYQDQTEIFMDGKVYELYFYDKRVADLKEMVHEQMYLNVNPYPKMMED